MPMAAEYHPETSQAGVPRGNRRCHSSWRYPQIQAAEMIGLHTNVLLRYLVQGGPVQSRRATEVITSGPRKKNPDSSAQ
jgi:hypothetical protein